MQGHTVTNLRNSLGRFRKIALIWMGIGLSLPLWAFGGQQNSTVFSQIPDNGRARVENLDYITAPLYELTPNSRIIDDPMTGFRVRMRVEVQEARGFTYIIFENEVREPDRSLGIFPLVGAGNFVIRRNHEDGKIDQIKVFLGQGPHVYLRLSPQKVKSTASFYAYNDQEALFNNLPLPVSIERVLGLPTRDLLFLLEGSIQWASLIPRGNSYDYEFIQEMVQKLREELPHLPDAEDGAMDDQGRLVKIESMLSTGLPGFNCSGFAKWVADGVYHELTGSYLGIPSLKQKHLDLRGSALALELEDLRDPYFGLDWTRNIATAINTRHYGVQLEPEDSDVRTVPFFEYVEDLGYPVRDLWQIMYFLALDNPGSWYLGSVNGEFGQDPVLWQHYHVVVFFPYIDDQGNFRVVVMERNLETGIDNLIRRYPQEYMHLVQLPSISVDSGFEPPKIEY
ncbi:hypothetical protein [Spirochaeta lutea]|nr:hypothetical protein [Spirochaeta lutea]